MEDTSNQDSPMDSIFPPSFSPMVGLWVPSTPLWVSRCTCRNETGKSEVLSRSSRSNLRDVEGEARKKRTWCYRDEPCCVMCCSLMYKWEWEVRCCDCRRTPLALYTPPEAGVAQISDVGEST